MRSKKRLLVVVAILVVLLVIGAVILTQKNTPSASVTPGVTKNTTQDKETITETDTTDTESAVKKESQPAVVDPSTLRSVAVEPLAITVFYSVGTPGFEFEVLRTVDKTEYVQFTSPELVGTKCTDDQGAFATILKNPSDTESQTTSQTMKVGSDSYGLSLSGATCTGDVDLLTQYQDGFKNGFANLSAL